MAPSKKMVPSEKVAPPKNMAPSDKLAPSTMYLKSFPSDQNIVYITEMRNTHDILDSREPHDYHPCTVTMKCQVDNVSTLYVPLTQPAFMVY